MKRFLRTLASCLFMTVHSYAAGVLVSGAPRAEVISGDPALAAAAVTLSPTRLASGNISPVLAQGMSLQAPVELRALTPAQHEVVGVALDHLNQALTSRRESMSGATHATASSVEDHLLSAFFDEGVGPAKLGRLDADVTTPEDYRLAFASPQYIGLSEEVLTHLNAKPDLLAEYVYHVAAASMKPALNKAEQRQRYAVAQREIFGAQNNLGKALRSFIDGHAAAEGKLGLRGGNRGDHGDSFYERLRTAFVQYYDVEVGLKRMVDIYNAERAAETLSRMHEGAAKKLIVWGVLNQEEADMVSDQVLLAGSHRLMKSLAHKMAALTREYEEHGYTQSEIQRILMRLPPYALLERIKLDTRITRDVAAEVVFNHIDFDTWIYRADSVVQPILVDVKTYRTAWAIVVNYGIEHALEWTALAKPIVEQMTANGIHDAWDYVLDHGIVKSRKYLAAMNTASREDQ